MIIRISIFDIVNIPTKQNNNNNETIIPNSNLSNINNNIDNDEIQTLNHNYVKPTPNTDIFNSKTDTTNNNSEYYNNFIDKIFDNNTGIHNNMFDPKTKISDNECNINVKNKFKRKTNVNINNNFIKRIKINNTYIDESKLREPENFDDIQNLIDKDEWLQAVEEELSNMTNLKVYNIIKYLPSNANVITTRWVFKYKRDSDGRIVKRKARLVARGYTQEPGTDFHNTFAPTLKQDSLRIITSIAVNKNFNIKQIDVNSAYLNAPLKEEIYIEAPQGYSTYNKAFWKLNKALYGLKQSANAWNNKLNETLSKLNFKRIISDPCIYKKVNIKNDIICLLAVYVDDIIIAGTDNEIKNTIKLIKKEFKIKEIGNVDFIIGIKFQKYKNGYILHQKRYINDIINKYNKYLSKPSDFIKQVENDELKKIKVKPTLYRSLIGNLLYLAISTRPDILFAVTKSARKSSDPNKEDWINLLNILEYLKRNIIMDYSLTNIQMLKLTLTQILVEIS